MNKFMKMGATLLLIASVPGGLAGCANGVPTESNMGVLWATRASACRATGEANDQCVTQDLNRCKAMVDIANPGKDETTYMTITEALTTIVGGVSGYAAAGLKGASLANTGKALTGEVGGGGIGTEIGYYPAAYRQTIDECMAAFSGDLHLTEQYFSIVKYDGKVTKFEDALAAIRAAQASRR